MEQLLLINPRKRKSTMSKKRKSRTAAQRAATAKMLAANRRRRSSKPASYASNPAPRKRRKASSVVTRHVSRRRRNPIRLPSMAGVGGMVKPAMIGAAGAVAVDAAMAYVPLPAVLTSGNMALVTRGAAAVLLGTVGRKLIGPAATTMAVGALTVTAYSLAKNLLAQSGFALGYVGPGIATGMPAVSSAPAQAAGMGAYLPNRSGGVNFGPRNFAGNGLSEYVR